MRAQLPGVDGAAAGVSSDKVSVLTMVDARGDAMAAAACRGEMGGRRRPARHGGLRAGGGGGLHRPPAVFVNLWLVGSSTVMFRI